MLYSLGRFVHQFIPQYCIGCKTPISLSMHGICEQCLDQIEYSRSNCPICSSFINGESDCSVCTEREFYIDKHISITEYSGIIKKMLHAVKFDNNRHVIKQINKLICQTLKAANIIFDFITEVPIEKQNKWQRGYNQSGLMAKAAAKAVNMPFVKTLKINKSSKNQKELNYSDRFIAIIDKYNCIATHLIQDKAILIIDDVFTTGATLNECARVLKKDGASPVFSISLARVRKIA